MAKNITIKRGLDINILGDASTNMDPKHIPVKTFAVIPDDYIGFSPKVCVTKGDKVHKGTPIIIDKKNADICLVSPLSGFIKDVVRGERRMRNYRADSPVTIENPKARIEAVACVDKNEEFFSLKK